MGSSIAVMDSNTYSESVARNAATAIKASGSSLAAIAETSGIPRSTLERKLRGVGSLTVREVKALADALGVTAQALTTVIAAEIAA